MQIFGSHDAPPTGSPSFLAPLLLLQEDYSKEAWMQDTTGLFEGAGTETLDSPHCLDVRRV